MEGLHRRCFPLLAGFTLLACGGEGRARTIPEAKRAEHEVPAFIGSIARDRPLAPLATPQHPAMAANGRSAMHVDAAASDTYDVSGPHGDHDVVRSDRLGLIGGECSTINFDKHGRVVALCMKMSRPHLRLLEPESMRELAAYELPKRATPSFELQKAMHDTSGGSYFYLDRDDHVVVGTSAGTIAIIAIEEQPEPHFRRLRTIDVKKQLALRTPPDRITAVMPDWQGHYWFTGRYGVVGVVGEHGPSAIHLPEEIENSFSVGPDGVYIASDHALYRFERGPDGAPHVVWRVPYDRGTRRKVGQINQGTGTTPTLLGSEYVAIVDNAEPRENALVFRRDDRKGAREVCKVPLFEPDASATENSVIGYKRSLIIENNAGYDLFTHMRHGKVSAPGVARVDIREDESGCDVRWTSLEISETVVHKLSTVTGLVYLYTKRPHPRDNVEAFYLTALDFETGVTVFSSLVGVGMRFDNNWAELALGPSGNAYVGVLNGIVRIADRGTSGALRVD